MGRPIITRLKKAMNLGGGKVAPKGTVLGNAGIIGTAKRPIIVKVKPGRGAVVNMIVMDLYNEDAWRKSEGRAPLELDGFCPRCGDSFRIPGDKFRISTEFLDKPYTVVVPYNDVHTGEPKVGRIQQTVVVSVEGVRTCPGLDSGGKGICGYRFVLTDNVMSPA